MSSHLEFANQAPGEIGYRRDHSAAAHLAIVDRGRALVETTRKKIAICGFATSTRGLMPIEDPEWECWGMNQFYRHAPRLDRQFDIHANWREENVDGTDHEGWLATCGIPVYMLAEEPTIPTSMAYPADRIVAKHGLDYLTSSVAYMLALAIDEIDRAVARRINGKPTTGLVALEPAVPSAQTPTAWEPTITVPPTVADTLALIRSLYAEYTIGVFGIDLIVGTEYDVQKPCAEYWLGVAEGRGITVAIPPACALLKGRRYGMPSLAAGSLVTLPELATRSAQIAEQLTNAQRLALTLDGARQENEMMRQVLELRAKGGTIPFPVPPGR